MRAFNWKMLGVLGMLILILSFGGMIGCGPLGGPTTENAGEMEIDATMGEVDIALPALAPTEEVIIVELFFLDEESGKLVGEKREISKVTGIARATLQELLRGPAVGSRFTSAVPVDTVLLDLNIREDGRCIVDLSRDFKSNLGKHPNAEILAVYALVNTLTQFSTVKEVQLLINQQPVDTLAGEVDLTQPLMREVNLVKR